MVHEMLERCTLLEVGHAADDGVDPLVGEAFELLEQRLREGAVVVDAELVCARTLDAIEVGAGFVAMPSEYVELASDLGPRPHTESNNIAS